MGADRIASHALGFEHFPHLFVVDNHRIGNAFGHRQTNLDGHVQIAADIHLLAIREARLQGDVKNGRASRNGKSRLRGHSREIGNLGDFCEDFLDDSSKVLGEGLFCDGDRSPSARETRKFDLRRRVPIVKPRVRAIAGRHIDRHAGHGFCPIALALCVPSANANLVALAVLQARVLVPRCSAQVLVERAGVGAAVDGLAVDPVALIARADLCVITEHGRFAGFVSHGVEMDG